MFYTANNLLRWNYITLCTFSISTKWVESEVKRWIKTDLKRTIFSSHTNRLFEKSQLSKQIESIEERTVDTRHMEWRKPSVKMRTCARARQIQWPPAGSDCLTEVSSDSPMNNSKISKFRSLWTNFSLQKIGNWWFFHYLTFNEFKCWDQSYKSSTPLPWWVLWNLTLQINFWTVSTHSQISEDSR